MREKRHQNTPKRVVWQKQKKEGKRKKTAQKNKNETDIKRRTTSAPYDIRGMIENCVKTRPKNAPPPAHMKYKVYGAKA